MRTRGLHRLVSALALAAAFVLIASTDAFALSAKADTTWMTNGKVLATAQYGNVMFIGGEFTSVTSLPPGTSGATVIHAQNLAAIDMVTGQGIATFHPSVAGDSNQVAQVQSLAVVGNTLYVGGQFDAVGGQAHYNVAAVDVDPGTDAGTVDAGFNATVGVPGASNEGTSYVYKVLAGASGLYVGGAFGTVDGTASADAAELAWDGTLVTSWTVTGVNGDIRDMEFAPDANTIFVAGAFSAFDGSTVQSIARISSTTGALDVWAIPPGGVIVGDASDPGMTCWSLAVSATRLFAGCGRGPNYVAAFRLDNGDSGDRTWDYSLVGNPQAIALTANGSQLVFGGHFGTFLKQKVCGKKKLKNLGILKTLYGTQPAIDCKFRPQFEGPNPFGGVWEIQLTPAYLWVGGEFTTIGGVPHQGVARFTF